MAEVQLATLAAEAREAIDSQDLARAADACRRALMRFPRWVEGYWLLGHILVESGYVAQARSCFEAVASAMPDDPRAYQGLADVAEQQKDLPTAVAGLIRALEVGETSPGVLEELRRLQQQAGYVVDNPFTTARVAHARLIAGQYEEADVAAERALQQEPERLDLLVVQAVARLFGGDRRGSEAICQRLLDISPDCLKALAIVYYLRPDQQAASVAADLSALDPEGQTLVWLRGQMTTLGYEADDLPSAPNLVRWQEETAGRTEAGRELRPLDRLIPELEEVWPQWLKQAATEPADTKSREEIAQPPPPADVATSPAPATPSFLGDVDTLAREFEDAMRPAVAPTQPSVAENAEALAPATAVPGGPPMETAVDWAATPPDGERDQATDAWAVTESAAPAPPEVAPFAPAAAPAAPPAAAPVAQSEATLADDEFGPWRRAEPAAAVAASAEAPVEAPAAAESEPAHAKQSDDAWAVPEQAEATIAPAAVLESPVQPEPQPISGAVAAAPESSEQPQQPPKVVENHLAGLRETAAAAAVAGDYWSAIERYGAVLAALRATPGGGE